MKVDDPGRQPKLLFVVTEDWYFHSHRLPLACAARDAGFDIVVVTRVGDHAERIISEGFRLHPIDMRRGALTPVRDMGTLLRLMRILRLERPAVVHNVALKPVILGTVAARLTGRAAIINALGGLGYVFASRDLRAGWLRRGIGLVLRILLRSSALRTIVQNEADREVVRSLGVRLDRIALIAGSGVDTTHFRPSPEPSGPIVATMVSRMLRDKGVMELVNAARIVQEKSNEVVVRLVGAPDVANPSSIDASRLKSWVAEGIVEWLGQVQDVRPIWAAAHIAVLPSYREGLPKSLLEAAACGRPIIATDVPGCRDVVIHERTGLLVPARDPEALAAAILRLAGDAELRARLGRAARERVADHFSIDKVVAETLALYRSMLTPA